MPGLLVVLSLFLLSGRFIPEVKKESFLRAEASLSHPGVKECHLHRARTAGRVGTVGGMYTVYTGGYLPRVHREAYIPGCISTMVHRKAW